MEIKRIIVGELETNCYLLVSENELVILDPGGEAEKILREIKKIKAKPKYIINTHCHPDHISANDEIERKTGVEILRLKGGDETKMGKSVLEVIQTPGHTKDSICLLGDDFIFTGDTLFAKDGYGRTDLPGGSQKEMEESLERLSKLIKPGMTVYPGHGEIFKFFR